MTSHIMHKYGGKKVLARAIVAIWKVEPIMKCIHNLLYMISVCICDAHIMQACRSMQKCASFCNYQSHTQLILCRIGWYQRCVSRDVIAVNGSTYVDLSVLYVFIIDWSQGE